MSLHFQETLVTGGGPQDFPTVRHLVLRGSNYEIGRQLAQVVMKRYNLQARTALDPRIVSTRRLYFQQHYPILLERALGVADAFDISPDDNMASLMYPGLLPPQTSGCSVVFYPPQTTTKRSLEVSFYLKDEPSADERDPRRAIRSDYYRFQLNAM